jgi:Tol biopolymer transport system component
VDWQSGNRPALSPDGKFIAYDALVDPGKPDREVRIMASDASREVAVAHAPGINASPIWSRDGSQLVFKSNRSGSFGIWSVPVRDGHGDGTATRLRPTSARSSSSASARLAPFRDGRRVIFGTDSRPTVEIWALENFLPAGGKK